MSWPNECWFNVYRSGYRGLLHPSRKSCETAGTPSCVEGDDIGIAYRVHVKRKPVPLSPADRASDDN